MTHGTSRIGCHALVWTGTFDADGVELAVRRTAEAGFDLVEFPIMDPAAFDARAARRALDAAGLTATGSLGLGPGTDISSEDDTVVRRGEEVLSQAVDAVAELGGDHLCGVLYSAMRKYMEPATPRGVANSRAALSRVARRAAAAGIRVSLEVVNRYETNVLNTARQADAFVRAVDGADLGVHLDTYHMNIEETDMVSPVLDVAERLSYVHVGESHRGYLGTGTVDFDGFFTALRRVGYTGPIVFESFSSAVVAPDLSRMLGIWRNLWDDNVEMGAHANRFVRDRLIATASAARH